MPRTRVSTTVDGYLLSTARGLCAGTTDAALPALLARHRAVEIDAAYGAYDRQPLTDPDESGDLASFLAAAAAS